MQDVGDARRLLEAANPQDAHVLMEGSYLATLDRLGQQCQVHLLHEKWLVSCSVYEARLWKDQLAFRGYSSINLQPKSLHSLALGVVMPSLASQTIRFAGPDAVRTLLHSILYDLQKRSQLSYFSSVLRLDRLARLLARSITDLRLASIAPKDLRRESFEDGTKYADLQLIFQIYEQRLEELCLADYAACLQTAEMGLADGTITLPDDLKIYTVHTNDWLPREQRLIDALASRARVEFHSFPPPESQSLSIADLPLEQTRSAFFSGFGAINEIRGLQQRIFQDQAPEDRVPLDQIEILYANYREYVPLLFEHFSWLAEHATDPAAENAVSLEALPVTFSEGVACIYSRPGRALRGWVRWIQSDFLQSKIVEMIREGLLAKPAEAESVGFSRLADCLRKLPIGFQQQRYSTKLEDALKTQQERKKDWEAQGERYDERYAEEDNGNRSQRDFAIPTLKALSSLLQPLLVNVPKGEVSAEELLGKAKTFLLRSVRVENALDRLARRSLLEALDRGLETLTQVTSDPQSLWDWLERLPIELRIMKSAPQPGRVHIAPLREGGLSGRPKVFVVGLDQNQDLPNLHVDSVLLDVEREKISRQLWTTPQWAQRQRSVLPQALHRILSLPNSQLVFSYSTENLVDDRKQLPAAELLQVYRKASDTESSLDEFLEFLGEPECFVSKDVGSSLLRGERLVSRLLHEPSVASRQSTLLAEFSHLRDSQQAREFRQSSSFTAFDGWVPQASEKLNPGNAAQPCSASRLETFGACPRRFFFRYGLGVEPPDEFVIDPQNWLDPMQLGSLLHKLLEDFMRHLTRQELIPNFKRDRKDLRGRLASILESMRERIPVSNEAAYQQQETFLQETCEIFLHHEESYCQSTGARPWVQEAALGLSATQRSTELDCPDPIPLRLQNGRVLQMVGKIDRVDRLISEGAENYVIWDYKSGTKFGFDEKALRQGRKLQPWLYVGMLRHRIQEMGNGSGGVTGFGYFFPTPKAEGARISWQSCELESHADSIDVICDLIEQGVFPPSSDEKDCKFCEYLSVCGPPSENASSAIRKALSQENAASLGNWKQLRELDKGTL